MYTTEKMWKKFIRTRYYRKWRKKWCFPLQTEPENMTPEEFAMADAYMHGPEVASVLPDGYDLRIDPADAAKPNGGRNGKHITLSGLYWIAAAGKLFPDKSLRFISCLRSCMRSIIWISASGITVTNGIGRTHGLYGIVKNATVT